MIVAILVEVIVAILVEVIVAVWVVCAVLCVKKVLESFANDSPSCSEWPSHFASEPEDLICYPDERLTDENV